VRDREYRDPFGLAERCTGGIGPTERKRKRSPGIDILDAS
jgi:hypothetical protein